MQGHPGVLFNRFLDADLSTFIGIIFWGALILGVLWAIFGIWSDFYGEDPKRPAAFYPDKKTWSVSKYFSAPWEQIERGLFVLYLHYLLGLSPGRGDPVPAAENPLAESCARQV